MDATATVLHAATGAEPEAVVGRALHGRSLLPLLSGAQLATPWRDAAYMEFHGDWYGHYSIRTIVDGRYKLAWDLSDRCELYDLEEDPLELENRFAKAGYREISARLLHRIQEEGKNLDDAHVRLLIPELELA
jgi:arylsulfatase A-like enzyme